MKKYIYKTLLFLFVVPLFTSCDTYLDLRPEDGIIRQEFWQTKEDVQAAVIGAYSAMVTTAPTLFRWGELRGDMLLPSTGASSDEQNLALLNIVSSNELTEWAEFYEVINYCNTIIDLAPVAQELDPTFTEEELNAYLAEALAMRAYMYFTLARTFGDVPLKLEATLSDGDDFQIPTSPQVEVLQQVAADLEEAEPMARENYGSTAANKGRFTSYAINAMQADVYLWLGEYQLALEAANKVINSGVFSLIPNNAAWFSTVFAEGNSSESIFEFQYPNQGTSELYDLFENNRNFIIRPGVVEEVFGLNFQDPSEQDIRGEGASIEAASASIYKYSGLNRNVRKARDAYDTHWFVYRYADVLLMKAEALNQLGRGAQALSIIEEIREIREAIPATAMNVSPDDTSGITDYLLAERAREFAYEGKRWFDVLRNARRNNYERLDLITNMAISSAPPELQQTILAKLQDPNSHYLPIYFYELYANKALEQNPYYE